MRINNNKEKGPTFTSFDKKTLTFSDFTQLFLVH